VAFPATTLLPRMHNLTIAFIECWLLERIQGVQGVQIENFNRCCSPDDEPKDRNWKIFVSKFPGLSMEFEKGI